MNGRIKILAAGLVALWFVAMLGVVGAACEETVRDLEAETAFRASAMRAALPEAAPAVLIQTADELPPTSLRSATSPANGGGCAWTTIRCRIVHYCECQICTGKREGDPAYGITATGTRVTEGRTVAVDPTVIPLGSEVWINGHSYTAEDTGVRGEVVDIYVPDHEQARQMGTYKTLVMWR